MQFISRIFELSYRPTLGVITLLLAIGLVFVGFGNADRMFWRMTSTGATLPGLVVDVRSYRPPDASHIIHVPTVAFRDDGGKVRVMEPTKGASRLPFEVDQPVLVKPVADGIAVDRPFRRTVATSLVMSLFTAVGIVAWLSGIWLVGRRIWLSPGRVGQLP